MIYELSYNCSLIKYKFKVERQFKDDSVQINREYQYQIYEKVAENEEENDCN